MGVEFGEKKSRVENSTPWTVYLWYDRLYWGGGHPTVQS